MMTYEKPWAEYVDFETEHVMSNNLGPGLDLSEGVEDDW